MGETDMIRKCDWREMYPFLSSFIKTTGCYGYEREPKGRKKKRDREMGERRRRGKGKETKVSYSSSSRPSSFSQPPPYKGVREELQHKNFFYQTQKLFRMWPGPRVKSSMTTNSCKGICHFLDKALAGKS